MEPEEVLLLIISLKLWTSKEYDTGWRLRKNKPEITALFLNGKQREVYLSIFDFMSNLTLHETRLSSSLHHSIMMTCAWARKKITNVKLSCKLMPLKVGLIFWTRLWQNALVRDQQGNGFWKHFLSLSDVIRVNVFVLWMLKYPKWQKKNHHRRCLYLLSLGEKMVSSRPRVEMTTYSQGHESTVCLLQATNFHLTVKKGAGRWLGRCSICPTAKDRRTHWKCCQCSKWVCKDRSIKTIQIKSDNCKEQSY